MAKFSVAVEQIKSVEDYLNTDKLSIARILGYSVIIKCNKYKEGDTIVYIIA